MIRYIGTALASAAAVAGTGYNYVHNLQEQLDAKTALISQYQEREEHRKHVISDAIRNLENALEK